MTRSKKEKSLFSRHDREFHNSPTQKTNKQQPQQFVDINGQIPYVDNYWIVQPRANRDQSMQHIPYVQYPPSVYYPPYDYLSVQPQYLPVPEPPPTPVSKGPFNKPSAPLPSAPMGRIPQESTFTSAPLGAVYPPMMPVPVQQTVAPFVPFQYGQPPPAPYYYPYSPPSQYYHSHRSPRPYHHHHHDRSSLPPIPRRERRHERDYSDRSRRENPLIMSYFGRRHDINSYRKHNRWYS